MKAISYFQCVNTVVADNYGLSPKCLLFLFCRTELTKNVVLPELVELARDEGSSVRLAAFETLVNLLEMFDAGKIH